MKKTTAIILAAGTASRMQTQKLTLPLAGKVMLQHTIDLVQNCLFDEAILVTTREIAQSIQTDMQVIYNERPELGQSESIRRGTMHAAEGNHLFFFLGDQPFLDRETVGRMQSLDDGASIIRPIRADGSLASPALFAPKFRAELLALSGDIGGRAICNKHKAAIKTVSVSCERVLWDIDTAAEYERANQYQTESKRFEESDKMKKAD